jgi:3-hydroxyisobutyrate dehydrogenase
VDALHVGFVGLGDIGAPMARRIILAGFPCSLWARRPATLEQFGDLDYTRADTPADLGRSSDVVCVCVFDDDDVLDVILRPDGLLAGMQSGVLAIHSTVSVSTCLAITRAAAGRGVAVVDAPVSGGRARALDGALTVMAGGPRDAFEQIAPVLRAFGQVVQWVGDIGSGQKLKLLNNVVFAANLRIAAEAVRVAELMGLDRDGTQTILRTGSSASFAAVRLLTVLDDPARMQHTLRALAKDIRAFETVRAAADLEPSLLEQTASRCTELAPDPTATGA